MITTTYKEKIEPMKVIDFFLRDLIHPTSLSRMEPEDREEAESLKKYRGFLHVVPTKEILMQGKSMAINNYEFLKSQVGASHWTPFIYYRGGKNNAFRSEKFLRAIPGVWVELDEKHDIVTILDKIQDVGLPNPALVLESPRGIHIAWCYQKPLGGTSKQIGLHKYMQRSITAALKDLGADFGASPIGYFRMPANDNILYYNPVRITVEELRDWADINQYIKNYSFAGSVFLGGKTSFLSDPAIQQIINNRTVYGQKGVHGRYNAIFTIALAYKADGKPEQDAYQFCHAWNQGIAYPLKNKEVSRAVREAYRNREHAKKMYAPSQWMVEALSGHKMQVKWRIITPRKPRDERERSHIKEWENDIIQYIKDHTIDSEAPYIQLSWREFAERLNMPYSTFSLVIKNSKIIRSTTIGKGRGAKTFFSLVTILRRVAMAIKERFLKNKLDGSFQNTIQVIRSFLSVPKGEYQQSIFLSRNGPYSYLLI